MIDSPRAEAATTVERISKNNPADSACGCAESLADRRAFSRQLNQHCHCISLDRSVLYEALRRESGDPAFVANLIADRPNLVSNVSVFVSREDVAEMLAIAHAIEAAAALPGYRAAVLTSPISKTDFGTVGVFMSYDFHVTADGPRLIEINTNAGGALLSALIARAQHACCDAVYATLPPATDDAFDSRVIAMFESEWRRQRGNGRPGRIAIVDDNPQTQYLYPEFLLAQRLFEKHGIDATIADARHLEYRFGRLFAASEPVDLVYNRITDFAFEAPDHAELRAAYLDGAVVVTPAPHHHALLADKRNLVRLSDSEQLAHWGLATSHLEALTAVPSTTEVGAENAETLWRARKHYFFKPVSGYGGKAVYRGDKLTRRVWSEIEKGGYVAQEIARPGARVIDVEKERRTLKADIRLYTYDGALLIAAARLFQGQTTNFRTPGGGFAPVFLS